jgi:DNA-binding SARP family transcriptional activator/TolB-like protein
VCLRVVSVSLPPASQSDADGSEGRLCLTVLGSFAATINGECVRLRTQKTKALLASLALGDPSGESRERAGAQLWSEGESKRVRDSLRHAVKELNDALLAAGFYGFNPGRRILTLARSQVVTDLDAVMEHAAKGRVHPRLLDTQRLADTLLVDLETVDPAFQVWVNAKRHALHDRLNVMLGSALAVADAAGEEGAEIARALLNLDPTHEAGCRHLMRLHVARGEIGAALKVYKALWDLLAKEYGHEPSQDTQDLVVRIKQQTGWSARPGDAPDPRLTDGAASIAAPAAPLRPQRLFVTVKDFNLAGVPESLRSTVNGFRHELVTCLARFREWSVRTQAAPTNASVTPDLSSTEYILDATACCEGDKMRLIVSLADSEANIVWGDPFTLQTANLLASQQDIVRAIAVALKINLSADRQRRMSVETGLEGALHDTWLRGQDLLYGLNPRDWLAAQDLLQDLMRQAPGFSPVISSIVQLRNTKHIVFPGEFRKAKEHAAALRLAQRAVQLDPQDSRAQLCVAWAHQLAARFEDARGHADLAIELNPNDPWTLMATAQIFAYCGDYDKAVGLCTQSTALTPNPTPTQRRYASAIFFLAGRYRDSVAAAIDGLDPSPAFSIWPCASLVQLGRETQARRLLRRAVDAIRLEWVQRTPPDDRMIYRWLLHMFPIAVEDDWQRLRRCLAAAGGLVDEERFEDWRPRPPADRLTESAS